MMNFDDLDKKMRVYEQSIDQSILPDMFMVARYVKAIITEMEEMITFSGPWWASSVISKRSLVILDIIFPVS